MRLLLTRPREDALTLATILRARGHDPVIAPLMELRMLGGPPLALDGLQGVLATSANGVRALVTRTEKRDVTLYAVGPQTAETARSLGFARVISADGDSVALADLVARTAKPSAGPFLHAAGSETAGRLRQALAGHGFTIETVILYEATPVAALPPEADTALRGFALDGVLLFSPRSAKTFAGLVGGAGLESACAKIQAYCISAATAAALGTLNFARVAVAGEPNQTAILELL